MTQRTQTQFGRGAPSILDPRNKQKLVSALKAIRGTEGHAMPSRYVLHVLADADMVRFQNVKGTGRGRPAKVAQLTSCGQAIVNFAR